MNLTVVPLLENNLTVVPLLDNNLTVVPLLDNKLTVVPLLDNNLTVVTFAVAHGDINYFTKPPHAVALIFSDVSRLCLYYIVEVP